MRMILQRVLSASVRVADGEIARIGRGVVVLVGVEKNDRLEVATRAARKLATLRIFEDARGRMNLDAAAADAAFLVVSQFTLAGSLTSGRRPSFDGAAKPDRAEPVIAALAEQLGALGLSVATGRFGARMEVELVNDGPVTFVLDL